MSQAVRICTERPPAPCRRNRHHATSTTTAPFPGFIRGTSFDAAAPSRREALQQFHRLEMMVEVEERLRAESGLVLSDTADDSDDGRPKWGDTAGDNSGQVPTAMAALHDAREELAGRTLHADPYCMENVWSEAQRERQLEEEHGTGEDEAMFFARHGTFVAQPNALEGDTHAAIMDDLEELHSRIQKARARHSRHSSPLGDDAEGASLISKDSIFLNEEADFDPEHYVAPLLHHFPVTDGAELWLPQFGGEAGKVASFQTARDIFSDAATVQEALQLLQYRVHSDRPDVAACVQRCQEQQRQHQPMTTITNVQTGEGVGPEGRRRAVAMRAADVGEKKEATDYRPPRRESPPSAASLAAMVSSTLPAIPEELRNELIDQRRLLERLAAAQEASFRQLAREQQEAARRRIMAPRADPTMPLLSSSKLRHTEPFEIAEALQNLQADPKRPLPPVITISTVRPQPPALLPQSPPSLPPHHLQEELSRLHRHYEKILRDERRAWTDIMQKQKEVFEREKSAAVQTLRYAAEQRQHENTEEIKRAIASQELKRRRWQHASEAKQRIAFQKMLYKALPSGDVGQRYAGGDGGGRRGVAVKITPDTPQRPTDVAEGVKSSSVKRRVSPSKAESDEGASEKDGKKNKKPKRDLKLPIVRGPFSVVLPEEQGVEPAATSHDTSLQRVDEVVVLSDDEEKDGAQQPCRDARAGSRVQSDKRRKSLPSPAGKRGKVLRPQRSPYAVSSKPPLAKGTANSNTGGASASAAMKHAHVLSHLRGAGSKHRVLSKGFHGGSPHAFAVHDARTAAERNFYKTTETVLTDFVHSLDATLTPPPVVGGVSHLHESTLDRDGSSVGQAIFPRDILLLSDPLTSEELERRRNLQCAFGAPLPPPALTMSEDGRGQIQRPCDVYYFGEEHGALTPRRRAKLRAAEAQTRIEARHRLERIKALSLTSRGQKLGEPASHLPGGQSVEAEGEQRLADILANETIHSIIGDAAEASLFANLFKELEDVMVSAELRRLTLKSATKSDGSEHMQQQKEGEDEREVKSPDMVSMERVVAAANIFDAPINEELSLEGTVLRLLEDSLLKSLAQPTLDEKEEGEQKIQSENTEGREMTVPPQGGETALASDGVYETGTDPLWVREVVSATTDPLWRAAEGEVSPSRELSAQATTMTASGEHRPPSPKAITPTPLPSVSPAQMGVVLTMDGARGNVVPDATGTVRIVFDIAPVLEHLAAITPVAAVQAAQPTQGGAIASEDRRLPCATDEDLLSCEVVDAPITRSTHGPAGRTEIKKDDTQEVRPPLLVSNVQLGEFHPPVLTAEKTTNTLQVSPPQQDSVAVAEALNAQQLRQLELERQNERVRLCDNELIQRQMLEDQEDTLRASWHMLWDWQQMNLTMLTQHHYQQNPCDVASQPVSAAVPIRAAEVMNEAEPRGDGVLPPAPSASTIRDPITRFIFEWMHDYDETKKEEPSRKTFVELLHEASCVAEGNALQHGSSGTCTTEADVRRRLLLDIDNEESSSWLSSTHPSSIAEDGFPRFTTRLHQMAARPRRTHQRGGGANLSSETTETTRYTNSSSTLGSGQEAWSSGLSPPPAFPTAAVRNAASTTVTTSGSSRTWPSTSSSEKPHLRDTMLRHLSRIQPSDQCQQGEEESQRREYQSVEELRREVERVQAAEQGTATHDATHLEDADQESRRTGNAVALLPLIQRPRWW